MRLVGLFERIRIEVRLYKIQNHRLVGMDFFLNREIKIIRGSSNWKTESQKGNNNAMDSIDRGDGIAIKTASICQGSRTKGHNIPSRFPASYGSVPVPLPVTPDRGSSPCCSRCCLLPPAPQMYLLTAPRALLTVSMTVTPTSITPLMGIRKGEGSLCNKKEIAVCNTSTQQNALPSR